jgi:hypothetical protein
MSYHEFWPPSESLFISTFKSLHRCADTVVLCSMPKERRLEIGILLPAKGRVSRQPRAGSEHS